MDRNEQAKFINDLLEHIRLELMHNIDEGKLPDTWDGVELRWLIAYRANRAVFKGAGNYNRKREFNNTVIVNNL